MGNLFDSPWKVLVVAIVLIVLFGSKKLPDAARSLGKSMRILKTEVSDLHHDESDPAQAAKPEPGFPQAQLAVAPAPVPADQQAQIDELQQQIRDLQRAATMDTPANASAAPEPQHTQHTQPS